MLPTRQAEQQYARQTGIVRVVDATTTAAWAQIDPKNLSGSWAASVGQQVQRAAQAGQYAAAAGATEYVQSLAGDQVDTAGDVRPGAFTGVASDGRNLASLLYLPIIRAKQRIGGGLAVDEALAVGERELLMMVGTQVLDAGRMATSVAQVAEPKIIGYLRYLNPPSCSRCTVLAGRLYRWSSGFLRHPRCDCQMRPITRSEWDGHATDVTSDPKKAFQALTAQAQDQLYTRAGAQAIRDGADLGQVVNARRGMYTAAGRTFATTEGTTARGVAGNRLRAAGLPVLRLTPEQIYLEADGDRQAAIRLLQRYGYIT